MSERHVGASDTREIVDRFKELADNLPQAIFEIDASGRITYVNPDALTMFRYTESDVEQGVFALDMFADEERRRARENIARLMRGERVEHAEYAGLRRDGSRIPIIVYSRAIERDGTIVGIRGIVVDITERKKMEEAVRESERRFRDLSDLLPQTVFETDLHGAITFVNREGFARFGYSSDAIASGINAVDVLIPEDRQRGMANIARVMRGEKIGGEEYTATRKDGARFTIAIYSRPIERNGTVTGIRGIIVDTSQQTAVREALRKSEERLRALAAHLQSVREEERIRIAREVHDNLGQVLTALNMHLSLTERRLTLGEPMVERSSIQTDLAFIRSLNDSLITTVRGLVSSLRPEVLDNLGLVEAIEWQAQEFERQYGIGCTVFTNLNGWNPTDEFSTPLFRIVQEALTNVARHAEAAAVVIRLAKRPEQLVLEITDDGRGIADQDLARSTSFGVIGMRERVLPLRGEFSITGHPGTGTTVRVVVPV